MRTRPGAVASVALLTAFAWQISALGQTTQKVKLQTKETPMGKISNTGDTKAYSISPDNQHVAVLSKKGEKYSVVLDGKPGPEYDWIIGNSITFTADSAHLLYVVQQNNTMFVVTDGKDGKPYNEIVRSAVNPSPTGGRVAYYAKAKANSKTILVIDGEESKEYDQVGNLTFSPDAKRVAYGVESDGKQFFVVDNAPGKEFEKVAGQSFTWSPDSKRYAYAAVNKDKIILVIDGKDQAPADEISPPRFSADSKHLAYAIKQAGAASPGGPSTGPSDVRWSVILDGKPQKSYTRVFGTTLRFSPDSARLAFIAGIEGSADKKAPAKLMWVVDGEEQQTYEGFPIDEQGGAFVFSPDSKRTAYVAIKNQRYVVVIDGIEGKDYEGVWLVQFSPDNKKVAYLAKRDNRAYAVVNNSESNGFGSLANLLFSPDGKHMAYGAGREKSSFVVLDGVWGKDYAGIVPPTMSFSPDSNHLVYEATKDDKPMLVIDGEELTGYKGTLRGSRLIWDGNNILRALEVKEGDIMKVVVEVVGG